MGPTLNILEGECAKPVKLGPDNQRSVVMPQRLVFTYSFDVTVKFRLMPAHEPTGPQSVGGLCDEFKV